MPIAAGLLEAPMEPRRARVSHPVGARLAAGSPPGTVRAPLDAYGSTSETTERHIFQRGRCLVTPLPGVQVGFCPLVDQTEVAPIVIPTSLSRDNLVGYDFGRILQR